MNFLKRFKFATKLALMTGTAITGLFLFTLLTFLTVRGVRINSPRYQDIALAYQLAGDCYDPPASLVAAAPIMIALEDATSPEEIRKNAALLQQDRQAFEQAHQHYQQVLPRGPIRDLMRNESYPTGEAWFDAVQKEFIPALLAGNHDAARRLRVEKMDPIFTRHKAANDKLADMTATWIPTQEKNAASMIRLRTAQLALVFGAILLLMITVSIAITQGIVKPVRGAIDALYAMAEGDLSTGFQVDSCDEMYEVARALDHTMSSFREVLTAILVAARGAAAASTELTASAHETSDRARKHAQETQNAAATMVEMSSSIAETSQAAESAVHSGAATQKAAEQGQRIVGETMEVIRRTAEITTSTAQQIDALGRSSEQIGQIVNVIEEIATQTNLLALNAAIEAARAGEQGRGFAVVAGEVRRLAERTSGATHEIGEMIQSIQRQTAQAVETMESGRTQVEAGMSKAQECESALGQIVQHARESGEMVERIASASLQQDRAAQEIRGRMDSISTFSEHAATAGEEIVSACSDLARLASELEKRAQTFQLGGGDAAVGRKAAEKNGKGGKLRELRLSHS
jgi:methyl-accepting chemotaxis protein